MPAKIMFLFIFSLASFLIVRPPQVQIHAFTMPFRITTQRIRLIDNCTVYSEQKGK